MTDLDFKIEIIQEEGIFKGHTDDINEQILFFPDLKRLVSCGDDGSFIIWDYETKLPILKYVGKNCINHCIKYDENTVLAVDGSGELLIFDIPSAKLKKVYKDFTDDDHDDSDFALLLKLSKDLILIVCSFEEEHIIVSLSSGKLVRYIRLGSDLNDRISYSCRIMLSKSSKNAFFFNPGHDCARGCIREIDHKENLAVKKFGEENVHYDNFCSFLNSNNEEILVCVETNIDVFKVSDSGPRVSISKIIESSLDIEFFSSCISFPIFDRVESSNPNLSYSSFPQYLFLGDDVGGISIRKFNDECNFDEIAQFTIPECKRHEITNLGIYEMKQMKNEITIFASSEYFEKGGGIPHSPNNHSIFALNVKNIELSFVNQLELRDVEERTYYLKKEYMELTREENNEILFFVVGSFGEMFLYRSFF